MLGTVWTYSYICRRCKTQNNVSVSSSRQPHEVEYALGVRTCIGEKCNQSRVLGPKEMHKSQAII